MVNKQEFVGNVYCRLTILSIEYKTDSNRTYAKCKCSCGNEHTVRLADLCSGNTKSCGCYKTERDKRAKSHGLSKTRFYNIWCGMVARTTNPTEPAYSSYGGRGIKLCDSWLKFENFYNDMIDGYEDNLSIDRIDVNSGYCKENCRWATMSVQGHNKRKLPECLSDYIGVTFDSRTNKWRSRITLSKGDRKHLGMFLTQIEAAIAYDNASEEVYNDRPNKTVK